MVTKRKAKVSNRERPKATRSNQEQATATNQEAKVSNRERPKATRSNQEQPTATKQEATATEGKGERRKN